MINREMNSKADRLKAKKVSLPALAESETVRGSFPVVGIGASAGGFDAVTQLLSALSSNTEMAFVIILHLDPKHHSQATEIFSRSAPIPVREIKGGMSIESGHAYVIPHDSGISIQNGVFNLHPRMKTKGQPSTIDFFFQSLARDRKNKAIGVILSGIGSDGTVGLKAIKAEGGKTFAQDSLSAKHNAMPLAAVASGQVDFILSPREIAEKLEEPLEHPDEALNKIFELLRERTRVDFSGYKLTTINRRLQRRMTANRIKNTEEYAKLLQASSEEVKSLYEDIFIHVTEFFRDPESFQALKEHVFPHLIKDRAIDAPIRIWVPGCSSGEEAYSLLITLFEFLGDQASRIPIQIFATDISEQAIQKARFGIYSKDNVRNVCDQRLNQYFDEVPNGYKIKKIIRESIVFSRHDVTNNPPFAKLDLISCRNVLIYFASALQKRVLPIFHYALKRGGFLLLGRSETPSFLQLFTLVDKVNKIYCKVNETKLTSLQFPTGPYVTEKIDLAKKPIVSFTAGLDMQKDIDRLVLSKYAPPGVVIDGSAEILQVRGQVGTFLELPSGQVSVNLLKMVRPELLASLRFLVQSAKKQNSDSRIEKVHFKHENKKRTVNLQVLPVNPLAPAKDRQYLVFFEDVSPRPKSLRRDGIMVAKREITKKRPREKLSKLQEQYIAQLQLELEAMKEHQQSIVNDFASAQEELTSGNEELQSTNEELQSTNEELETAKEELQAANEELTTTNDELQNRNAELNALNVALARSEERFRLMVESVKDYAIFMLDSQGRVTTWNEGARRLKGYEETEVLGQHFSKFYPQVDLQTGKPEMELKVATAQGRFEDEGWRIRKDGTRFWANVVITAIRGPSGELLGFSKVTRDLTERKKMEDDLRGARDELEVRIEERTKELAQAIRVRDEFLSIASHELKTPLTSLKMQAQMRKKTLDMSGASSFTPEKLAKMVEADEKEIVRMAHLVDNMLDITRLHSGKLQLTIERVDLHALVREVIERFDRQLQVAGCVVSVESSNAVVGEWDRYRIEQVFTNLLTNAMKYGARKPVHVVISAGSSTAQLVVRDEGVGIAKEDQARIFQQFERAVSKETMITGLGLGLYIVRQIVESHGGSIVVQSEFGRGSTFTVELPLKSAQTQPYEPRAVQ
jgi:two-component system CheB/CheR fusion protein